MSLLDTFKRALAGQRPTGTGQQPPFDAPAAVLDRVEPSMGPGQLPTVALPKAPGKATALAGYKTQVAKAPGVLRRDDRRIATTDVLDIRQTQTTTRGIINVLAQVSPDLSATVASYLRVGIPDSYTVIARDMDGSINVEATKLAQESLRRLTLLGDPALGYNPTTDLQSLSESLGRELLLYGSMALELVLDKQRLPTYFNAVSTTKLDWKEEQDGIFPVQKIGSEERSLDIPTFFYLSVDQDLLSAYSNSYFESAIQSVLADAQFLNDLRKSMQRVIQPRMIATLIEDKIKPTISPEISNDPEKLGAFYNSLIAGLTEALTNLNPEDVLVGFDFVDYKMLGTEGGGSNIADTLKTVQDLLESKLASGAKTMPSVLGRDANAGVATTSSMLFLKNADIVRRKLNLIYSRSLTVALRLQAQDVFVEFEYADLDLRPQSELEAYKTMRQSRILEQLSLGLISDEEASIRLTGSLPRDGHVPLAGTMFKSKTAESANPNSQTSNMGGATDNLKPSTPAKPKD